MAETNKKENLDEVLGLDSDSDSEHKLEDIDPLFKEEDKKHSDTPISSSETSGEYPNVLIGGGAGALTGAAVERVAPKVEAPQPKGLEQARTQAQVAQKSVSRQAQRAAEAKAQHTSSVDAVHSELKAAQARLNAAQESLNSARANAIRLNAIPEPVSAPSPTVAESIPVDKGAMRHNVKMGNIVDYNAVRKGMTGTTETTQGMGRISGYTQSGRLIVPSELANAPLYNAEQIAAQKALAEAEAAMKSAQSNLTGLQARWKNMVGSTPKPVQAANMNLASASEKAAQAADRLAAIEAVKPTGLQRAGALVSKFPYLNVLGGALTGAEAVNAYEQGFTPEGVMSGMGALGGALMMVPHPVAKLGGAALSVPPLLYQGYKYLQEGKEQETP